MEITTEKSENENWTPESICKEESDSNYQSFSDTLKCGEVLVCRKTENFIFVCEFCTEKFKGVYQFLEHVKNIHLILGEKNDGDDKNQMIKEIECSDTNLSHEMEESTFLQEFGEDTEAVIKNTQIDVQENVSAIEFIDENDGMKYLKTSKTRSQRKPAKSTIVCEICDKKFTSKKRKLFHIKYDHETPDPFLSTTVDDETDIENNATDPEMKSKCENSVPEIFAQPIGIDPLSCKYCKKKFRCGAARVEHERIHTGEKPFKCEFCGKIFRLKRYCQNHILTHTGIKAFKCSECDAAFSHKQNLVKHIRTHTGERPYKCGFCEKRFSNRNVRSNHEKLHTGEKPYQCIICGKCFSSKSNLTQHKFVHSSEKPYKCDDCDKCFRTKDLLKSHSLGHSNEKPHKCDVCGASFSRRKALVVHSKLHSKIPEYVCKICGKAFKQKPGLHSHMKSHGVQLKTSSLTSKS